MSESAFFFTDIDSRAAVKGSRDPLGSSPSGAASDATWSAT